MLQNPAKSHRCCASSPHHSPPLPSSLPRPTLPRANLCYARLPTPSSKPPPPHQPLRCPPAPRLPPAHLRHARHPPHPHRVRSHLARRRCARRRRAHRHCARRCRARPCRARRCRVCRLCAHVSTRSVALYDIQLNFTHILGIGPQNTRVFRMPAGPCGPDQRQIQTTKGRDR